MYVFFGTRIMNIGGKEEFVGVSLIRGIGQMFLENPQRIATIF